MREIMTERKKQFEEIVRTFFNASRGHGMSVNDYDSPLERLGEFATLLYLMQRIKLLKIGNYTQDDKYVVALQSDPGTKIETIKEWNEKGITMLSLVREEVDKELDAIISNYSKSMRLHVGQQYIFEAYDLINKANLTFFEYIDLLAEAEEYFALQANKQTVIYSNPISLAELVGKILNKSSKLVQDPYMGTGSFAMYLPENCQFIGEDIIPEIVNFAKIKLSIANREFRCEVNDSINSLKLVEGADIVTFPPLGLGNVLKRDPLLDLIEAYEKVSWKSDLIVLVHNGFCFGSKYKQVRERLTNKNYLDKIIQLPSRYLYGTSISTTLLHLKNYRGEDNPIVVANAGEGAEEINKSRIEINPKYIGDMCDSEYILDDLGIKWIHKEDIVERNYDWSALSYPCERLSPTYRGAKYVKFVDCIESFKAPMSTDKDIRILNVRHIKSPFEKPEMSLATGNSKYVKLTEPALVVCYNVECFLYAIEASEDSPVYLYERDILYRCKKNVHPKYLASIFANPQIDKYQIAEGTMGDMATNVNINKLLQHQMIGLPSYPEQQMIAEESEKNYLQQQLAQTQMGQYVEQLRQEYVNEIRSRKHNMRPYLRELKSGTELAQIVLQKSTTIEEIQDKLLPILKKLDANRKCLSEIVDHLSQVDKFGEEETLDIQEALLERFRYHCAAKLGVHFELKCKPYNIEKDAETYGMYARFSSYDFKRMFDCIIENACVHGFENKYEGHNIYIDWTVEDDMYIINFTNDGLPFPEGFDINRYGLLGEKAGVHAGTGDGGHQVVSIVKHFGGYVTIESTKPGDPVQRVTISVHIPVYDKEFWDSVLNDNDE